MNEQPRPTPETDATVVSIPALWSLASRLERERDQLREQLKGKNEELARKLAAISVCALSNTQRARTEQGLPLHSSHELYTAAYSDVERLVASEMELREQLRLANEDAKRGWKWANNENGMDDNFEKDLAAHRERMKGDKQ